MAQQLGYRNFVRIYRGEKGRNESPLTHFLPNIPFSGAFPVLRKF